MVFLRVCSGNAGACQTAREVAPAVAEHAGGPLAAFIVPDDQLDVANLTFRDDAGAERSLGEWKGRTVLLNLWATWCVPCREEMPYLDALQRELGGDDFEVVAVNIDTRDPDKPKAFLDEIGITSLAYFADATTGIFQSLKGSGRAFGMPTTVLVTPDGCAVGHLAGPADWSSPEAKALVQAAVTSQ